MTTGLRLLKNSAALSLAAGLERAVAFILPLYIARVLGASGLGVYTVVTSLWLIFEALAYLGLDQVVMRDVARRPDQAVPILVNAGLVGTISSIAFGAVMVVAAHALHYPDEIIRYVYVVAGFVLAFDTLSTVAESVVKGLERMEYVLLVRFAANLVRIVLSIAALQYGLGLIAVFWLAGLYQVLMLVGFSLPVMRWSAGVRPAASWPLCRQLARTSLVFLGISLFTVAFRNADVILISKLCDMQTVGLYGAASKLVQIIQMMSPAIMVALFPILSRAFVTSPEQLARLVAQSLKLLLVALLPAAFGMWALAGPLVGLIYGYDEFGAAVALLRILAWLLPPYFASNLLFRALLASNNERLTLRVVAWNALLNLTLNLLLIPMLGATGACISAVATSLAAFAQNYYYVHSRVVRIDISRTVVYPIACFGLALALYTALLRVHPWLALGAALAGYGALLILSKTVGVAEWNYVKQSWQGLGRSST